MQLFLLLFVCATVRSQHVETIKAYYGEMFIHMLHPANYFDRSRRFLLFLQSLSCAAHCRQRTYTLVAYGTRPPRIACMVTHDRLTVPRHSLCLRRARHQPHSLQD